MSRKRVWGEVALVVEEVCLRLEAGDPLAVVCRDEEMPHESTLRAWLRRFPDLKAKVDAARATGLAVQAARPLVGRVRPVVFDEALARAVCERLAAGSQGLEAVCAAPDLPSSATVYRWLADYPEFADQYGEARRIQAHRMFDEARAIAKAATAKSVAVAKLRIDTLKWQAAKLAPRVYGARVERDLEPEAPVINVQVRDFCLEDEVETLRAMVTAAGMSLPEVSALNPIPARLPGMRRREAAKAVE
ncbi:hypothetical protein [Phenylobacterium sp.]|uniref:terminase small subunit-like protein n=1 Tax=Phenylobacterium sp. TaxID=1871053 RepID=UPI00271F46DA|nr:hypothetical protein [Phenylobacterium sp.]MDO8377424.1 hypothetical protein [Phenylobacterium sp.]